MGKAIDQFNTDVVDLVIHGGDMINDATDGTVAQNYAELVSWIDGAHASSNGLNADMLYCFGHWDIGGATMTGTDVAAAFTGLSSGVTDIIPAGRDADMWWPDNLNPDVANDTYCAYRFDDSGFMILVLCNPGAVIDMETTGDDSGGASTQEAWFESHLAVAEGAGTPVIVVTHQPLYTTRAEGATGGGAAAVIAMEAQTIKPVVIQGHIHVDDRTEIVNGIVYINLRGDLWGEDETDTGRFSHAVLEITSPTHTTINGQEGLVTLTGYGHQRSYKTATPLVAHWKLDEADGTAAGAGAIIDSSGNAYHGTNSEDVVSVLAPVGHGLTLDGTGDYIDDAAVPLLSFPCTFSAWYKIPSSQTSTLLMIALDGVTGINLRWMGLDLKNGVPIMRMKGGAAVPVDTVSAISAIYNEWVHVVGIWHSDANRDIYVNGVFSANSTTDTAATDFPTTVDIVTIGGKPDSDGGPVQLVTGSISDVRIYSGVLSASEIKREYYAGTKSARHRYGTKKDTGFARTRGRY
jgi:hypothetical protein